MVRGSDKFNINVAFGTVVKKIFCVVFLFAVLEIKK